MLDILLDKSIIIGGTLIFAVLNPNRSNPVVDFIASATIDILPSLSSLL